MSGGVSATTIATVVAGAATAASAGLAISNSMGGDAQSGLLQKLTGGAGSNANMRSQLLGTAGQSAGSPLAPGGVGGISNLFGN